MSTEERDPGLNNGYAYIVGTTKFKNFLEEYDKKIPEDKSTCNNHDTIKLASMRGGKGAAATGIATAECSRHDMKRPMAVRDLQKGERSVLENIIHSHADTQNPDMSTWIISFSLALNVMHCLLLW